MESGSPAIVFRNVSKAFPTRGGSITRAVTDFSATIPAGKITALVGSSGSGKTTLLRMINRMVDHDSGEVLVRGRNVQEEDRVQLRRSIGYVIQSGGLLPHKTVLANASTVPILNKEPRAEVLRRAQKALRQVGLDDSFFHRYPAQLSGGQQQRVGVARALAGDPDILLMDEPFGAVDPIVRAELQEQLLALQQELQKTIVIVTHDMSEAFLLADLVVVLEQGAQIAQIGTPTEIIANPESEFVESFIGSETTQRLQVREISGKQVVMDSHGRPLGVL